MKDHKGPQQAQFPIHIAITKPLIQASERVKQTPHEYDLIFTLSDPKPCVDSLSPTLNIHDPLRLEYVMKWFYDVLSYRLRHISSRACWIVHLHCDSSCAPTISLVADRQRMATDIYIRQDASAISPTRPV